MSAHEYFDRYKKVRENSTDFYFWIKTYKTVLASLIGISDIFR